MRCDICGEKECCGASLGPELEAITADRDRLREALEDIYNVTHITSMSAEIEMRGIAMAALQEDRDDT